MKNACNAINIFNYFDYREYLDDCFKKIKSKNPGFSFRALSKDLCIQSHNFLPRILKSERNLSKEFVPVLTDYLRLTGKEVKYFEALVAFNDARKTSIKEKYLKRLFTLRIDSEEYKTQDEKLRFFDKWYYPVIRDLVTICDFHDDYTLLARSCIPHISPAQAKYAVAFLLNNGFIRREIDGRYRAVEAKIAAAPEVDSAIIPKYHKATLLQCVDAIDTIKKEDRNFSSSTLLVSKELYEDFKKEIYHFRKRLLSMAKDCKNPEMVCFTGFELLPRSKPVQSLKYSCCNFDQKKR
jgi:uncharacterized protein (TIGR02147 family)